MSFLNVLDRPVAFHRVFVDITGSITSALMLSQIVYWSRRVKGGDGWFYKTGAEWTEETGMSRSEQETARRTLVSLGLIQEERRGIPCRLYFRLHIEALKQAILGQVKEVTLDQVLELYKAQLANLSRGAHMRAVKAGVESETVDYAEVLKLHGMVCGVCKEAITRGPGKSTDSLSFDHVVAIANGGPHKFNNLRPAHFGCNASKCDAMDDIQDLFGEAGQFAMPQQTSPLSRSNPARYATTNITENTKRLPSENTKESSAADACDARFDQFWAAYPNKKAKPAALKAWARLKVTDDLFTAIMDGLARAKQSQAWIKDDGQFIPHPTTFLNQRRWEDDHKRGAAGLSRHTDFDKRQYQSGDL